MKRERLLHVVLAVVGIGALTAYLVACRPAWSPDGSKLLFPYLNPETKEVAVALFDRETGKASHLLGCKPKQDIDIKTPVLAHVQLPWHHEPASSIRPAAASPLALQRAGQRLLAAVGAAALREATPDVRVQILDAPAMQMGWKSLAAEMSRLRPDYVAIGEEAARWAGSRTRAPCRF